MTDLFLSYSSDDRERAQRLAQALEARGLSVWWDRKIPPGRTYDEVIEEALSGARAVVVLWSGTSVGSDWVKTEAAEGAQVGRLVPARIEEVEIPLEFRRIQAADLIEWDGDPEAVGLNNLIHSVEAILDREDEPKSASETLPSPPPGAVQNPSQPPLPSPSSPWFQRRGVLLGGGGALLALIAVVLVLVLLLSGGSSSINDRAEAEVALQDKVGEIDWLLKPEQQKIQLPPPSKDRCRTLPPLADFPLVVSSSTANAVEIFSSSEKAGSGSDGWLVEVAEDFNKSGRRLSNGSPAAVEVRRIASGTGYEFIACGAADPGAFTPSNQLWIEMAADSGTTMTVIRDQLVPNVAGIVLKDETARELEATFGSLDAASFISAVNQGSIAMGYTDPFASSTGLNFLVTVLNILSDGDESAMLSSEVVADFESFQQSVPFVALTTLQIRESVEQGGQLDAFVMEYQTFAQSDTLSSGFQFIPFGVAHDNPLYAVGNADQETLEILELFASFAEEQEATALATQYGFDPPAFEPSISVPTGSVLLEAQNVWKEKKDGGKPVTAVFVADVSGSMEQGSRIEALREALFTGIDFIGEENSVGLVLFDDRTTVVLEIGEFDQDQKRTFGAAVAGMDPGGGTAMYDAIAIGLNMLVGAESEIPDAKSILIVLTDGESNEGMSFEDMEGIIEYLRIPVYTIGFEADIDELARVSSLVEAASLNADEDDVQSKISSLFNAQL